jgi:hypothetical protein
MGLSWDEELLLRNVESRRLQDVLETRERIGVYSASSCTDG